MNLKLPSTVLEVLPTKCSNRSGLAAAIQENVCWVARISAVSDKVAAVWRTINMISNSTKMRTLSAGVAMFVGEGVRETGPALAGALISMLPLLILYCFAQEFFVEGIAVSGMKE